MLLFGGTSGTDMPEDSKHASQLPTSLGIECFLHLLLALSALLVPYGHPQGDE